MKKLYVIAAVLPFMFACGAEESTAEESTVEEVVVEELESVDDETVVNSFIISEGTVGLFVVGREVPDIPKELKIRQFVEEEDGELHNVIFNQLEDVVELIMSEATDGKHHEDKVVEEMWVLSSYYETDKGVSVGTTVEEFTSIYDDTESYYSNLIDAYYIETSVLPNVQFILNQEDYSGKAKMNSEKETVSMSNFEYGAKIKMIRVH